MYVRLYASFERKLLERVPTNSQQTYRRLVLILFAFHRKTGALISIKLNSLLTLNTCYEKMAVGKVIGVDEEKGKGGGEAWQEEEARGVCLCLPIAILLVSPL